MRHRTDDTGRGACRLVGQRTWNRHVERDDRPRARARRGRGCDQCAVRPRRRAGAPLHTAEFRRRDQQVRHDVLRRSRPGVPQYPRGAARRRASRHDGLAKPRVERVVRRDSNATPHERSAAFSLADPSAVEQVLDAAGFAGTTFQDVREPVYYGDSVEAAFEWIGRFQATREMLQSLDAASAERERQRLREMLAKHYRGNGVWFDSRAWIVTARCRRDPP